VEEVVLISGMKQLALQRDKKSDQSLPRAAARPRDTAMAIGLAMRLGPAAAPAPMAAQSNTLQCLRRCAMPIPYKVKYRKMVVGSNH
jgi:hypothetical protein